MGIPLESEHSLIALAQECLGERVVLGSDMVWVSEAVLGYKGGGAQT